MKTVMQFVQHRRLNSLKMRLSTIAGVPLVLLMLSACSTINNVATPITESTTASTDQSRCVANPLGPRALYLRGSFNTWNADEALRFTYFCNRFELVTKITGPQQFKLGDDEWSADADFGLPAGNPAVAAEMPFHLAAKGTGIHYIFSGTHRLVFNMSQAHLVPTLTINHCPAPPLGETTLFLRGTMNNWTALDDFVFQYSCDAYYLNVKLHAEQEFKIADAAWANAATFGAINSSRAEITQSALTIGKASDVDGVANLRFKFTGEHTLRLALEDGKPNLTIGAKSFADPTAAPVTNPVALSVKHDSRDLEHKAPFGAITAGINVVFGLTALHGAQSVTLVVEKRRLEGNQDVLEYREVARLPLRTLGALPTNNPSSPHEKWQGQYRFSETGVYGYYFEVMIDGKTYIYQNNQKSIFWTREKGANGIGQIEEKPDSVKRIRRYRHTVYAADFSVPSWAKDVVYYYIFPERFRNGDTRNDPKPGVDFYQDKGIEFHKNWLDKPYKPHTGDGSDKVYNNDFFGGDIAGIIEKLDYIADLGANTLYITPMFKASSNHKYDTADYKNIDPMFGTNADFTRLTAEAARRGIRVIPDTSLNHVGSDSIYFDRFKKYQSQGAFEGSKINKQSPYTNWFSFDATQRDPDKQFKGWVNVLDLPELNKASPEFRKFAYGDHDSVMALWLDRGAAGWRMDVAPWVPDDFWREWRTAIKQHRPDALTIAETWFDSSKYFLGDTFDSTMNYIFRNTVLDYAAGGKANATYHNLEFIREVYPPQALYALMNLLSSHDVARTLHVLGNRDDRDEPNIISEAKQRFRLAVFFQMIFPGSPTIYYGDEVGVTGGEDPYNRATYPWADLGGKPDLALLADFKTLIKMRKDHAVLRHGSIDAPVLIDDHIILLVRKLGNSWAMIAMNNATTAKTVSFKVPADMTATDFVDALSGATISAANGRISFTVPALFGRVLLSP